MKNVETNIINIESLHFSNQEKLRCKKGGDN